MKSPVPIPIPIEMKKKKQESMSKYKTAKDLKLNDKVYRVHPYGDIIEFVVRELRRIADNRIGIDCDGLAWSLNPRENSSSFVCGKIGQTFIVHFNKSEVLKEAEQKLEGIIEGYTKRKEMAQKRLEEFRSELEELEKAEQ